MSIEGCRSLRRKWFAERGAGTFDDLINAAFDRIGFTQAYISQLRRDNSPRSPKVIKDNVWGMIEVDWQSIRLLDSPIIQRLRGIKQLGFSLLTYPSAEHSRFTHSLGMYAVVGRFLDAMRSEYTALEKPADPDVELFEIDQSLRADLSHAALLHDVGHMPFSHASEQAYSAFKEEFECGHRHIEDFLFDVSDALGKNLALSECLSLAVVLSTRFGEFYDSVVRPGQQDDEAQLRIASLIAGLPPLPLLRGPADLISDTAVDADKVDYVCRDAAACGIPVGIDVARLFLRSAFLRVRRPVLQKLLTEDEALQDPSTIFVVNASGLDTIEEISLARAALYQRVYLHQTTRNAERLLERAIAELRGTQQGQEPFPLRDVLTAWAESDLSFLNRLSQPATPPHDLARRLLERRLPKRASAFGTGIVDLFFPVTDVFPRMKRTQAVEIFRQLAGRSLESLQSDRLMGEAHKTLEQKICAEAGELADLIRRRAPDMVPEPNPEPLVIVLPMRNLQAKHKGCIILQNKELLHSTHESTHIQQQDANEIYKSLGYVMTSPQWRELVFLATKSVLYEDFRTRAQIGFSPYPSDGQQSYTTHSVGHVWLHDSRVLRRVGLDASRIARLRSAAESAGYFDRRPRLSMANLPAAPLNELEGRFRNFSGQGGWGVTQESIRRYVTQFPPSLREEVVEVLRRVHVLDRAAVADGIHVALRGIQIDLGRRGYVTGLSPDSGNHVRMLVEQDLREQLAARNLVVGKSLREVLSSATPGDHVVLCDDNISSGSQAECQLRAWLGVPREQWPEALRTEQGIDDASLDATQIALLRQLPITVAVCVGSAHANDRLGRVAQDLDLPLFRGVVSGQHHENPLLQISDELQQYLLRVGSGVLAWCRYGKEDLNSVEPQERETCRQDALGYGNAAGLLVTVFNVPVSTFTALWCPGFVENEAWIPLFIRRGYLNKLVIS